MVVSRTTYDDRYKVLECQRTIYQGSGVSLAFIGCWRDADVSRSDASLHEPEASIVALLQSAPNEGFEQLCLEPFRVTTDIDVSVVVLKGASSAI